MLKNRVGLTETNVYGEKMIIVAYRSATDIDVRFEDGTLLYHRKYDKFIKHHIYNPNTIKIHKKQERHLKNKETYLGLRKQLNSGLWCTIIKYIDLQHIIVQFDDGVTINTSISSFNRGQLTHPNINSKQLMNKNKRIGETVIHKSTGMVMTIIDYIDNHNITIQFEDGTIVEHKDYSAFKKGVIGGYKEPQYKVGTTKKSTNGGMMTIVTILPKGKVKVRFEDGTEVTSFLSAFLRGRVKNPNINTIKDNMVNKIYKDRNGDEFKVINYNNSLDIDIQYLDDGRIYQHRSRQSIIEKKVIPIERKIACNENKVFFTRLGLYAKMIERRNCNDIDIQFETGAIQKNVTYFNFKQGVVSHPFPYAIGTMIIEKPAYVYQGEGNFYCTCNKCGISDIMNLSEIRRHQCIT